MLNIRAAGLDDIEAIVPLFDAYRQFYRQVSDPERAREFLTERLERGQSVIFLAIDDAEAIGFTQLYPSFSSGAMARIYILNDLFVEPNARRRGAASELIRHAVQYSRGMGAVRLVLSTEATNATAQALYESLGWKRDRAFLTYQFSLL